MFVFACRGSLVAGRSFAYSLIAVSAGHLAEHKRSPRPSALLHGLREDVLSGDDAVTRIRRPATCDLRHAICDMRQATCDLRIKRISESSDNAAAMRPFPPGALALIIVA